MPNVQQAILNKTTLRSGSCAPVLELEFRNCF